ncbi:MAG: twin-arginine translocase subunit TatC [Anaerolineae bacterium]|nr:twin-arginine translocase subunit TatC [Anaerolineae bacterium]
MSQSELGILEHIEELRRRILWALAAVAAGVVISAFFADKILVWLTAPLPGEGLEQLEAISLTENVGVFMQATLLSGIAFAMPVVVLQLWKFIQPGLYSNERRYVYLLVPMATLLFLSGAAFCYYVMLPVAVPFMLDFLDIPTRPRPSEYFPFITSLLLWVGISFELPLLVFFLAKVRVVNHRALIKNWRVAILLIAVLAAAITPTPDPINMGIVMIPLVVLYFLSIFLAWIAYPKVKESSE